MAFQTAGARHTATCRAVEEPGLVEPLWNPCGTLWNCVEPYLRTTSDHPTALAEPRGTLVCGTLMEPQTTRGRSTPDNPQPLRQPCSPCRTGRNLRATLVEPWWNLPPCRPGGNFGGTWNAQTAALAEPGEALVRTLVVELWWHCSALLGGRGCEGYGVRFQKRSTRFPPGTAKAMGQL